VGQYALTIRLEKVQCRKVPNRVEFKESCERNRKKEWVTESVTGQIGSGKEAETEGY